MRLRPRWSIQHRVPGSPAGWSFLFTSFVDVSCRVFLTGINLRGSQEMQYRHADETGLSDWLVSESSIRQGRPCAGDDE